MENLNVGITLMVIGMATVFVFLAIMIVAMYITTKVIGIINIASIAIKLKIFFFIIFLLF